MLTSHEILRKAAAALDEAGIRWMLLEPVSLALLEVPATPHARVTILADGVPFSCSDQLNRAFLGQSGIVAMKWSWFILDASGGIRITIAQPNSPLDHASLDYATSVAFEDQTVPVAPLELLLIHAIRKDNRSVIEAIEQRGGIDWDFLDATLPSEIERWDRLEVARVYEQLNRLRRIH